MKTYKYKEVLPPSVDTTTSPAPCVSLIHTDRPPYPSPSASGRGRGVVINDDGVGCRWGAGGMDGTAFTSVPIVYCLCANFPRPMPPGVHRDDITNQKENYKCVGRSPKTNDDDEDDDEIMMMMMRCRSLKRAERLALQICCRTIYYTRQLKEGLSVGVHF